MKKLILQVWFIFIFGLAFTGPAYSDDISMIDAIERCKSQLVIESELNPSAIPQSSDEISKKAEIDLKICMAKYGFTGEEYKTNSDIPQPPGFFGGLFLSILLWAPIMFILYKLENWGLEKIVNNIYFFLSISVIVTVIEFFATEGNILFFVGAVLPTALLFWFFTYSVRIDKEKELRWNSLTPAEQKRELANEKKRQNKLAQDAHQIEYGALSDTLICPHCQSTGTVRSKSKKVVEKSRVNSVAGKAIGLGMDKEMQVTQLHCDNCNMTWNVK